MIVRLNKRKSCRYKNSINKRTFFIRIRIQVCAPEILFEASVNDHKVQFSDKVSAGSAFFMVNKIPVAVEDSEVIIKVALDIIQVLPFFFGEVDLLPERVSCFKKFGAQVRGLI